MQGTINCNKDILKQAPDILGESAVYIQKAKTDYDDFLTSIRNAKLFDRHPEFLQSVNSHSYNLDLYKASTQEVQTMISNTVSVIENFENGYITVDEASVAISDLGNATTTALTGQTGSTVVGTNEGNEGFWDWVARAGKFLLDAGAWLVGTLIDAITSLFIGLISLVDKIIDAAIMLGGTIASGFCLLVNLFGANLDVNAVTDWTESAIMAFSLSDMARDAIYGSEFMQRVTEYSGIEALKQATGVDLRGVLETAGEWVGIAAICVATGGLGAPAAVVPYVGMGVGAAKGFGGGAELAFENDMGFGWALGLGTAFGVVDGYMGYCTGNAANVFISSNPKLFQVGGEQLALTSGNGVTTLTGEVAGVGGLPAVYDPAFAANVALLPALETGATIAAPSILAYGSGIALATAVDTVMANVANGVMANSTPPNTTPDRPGGDFGGGRPTGGGGRPDDGDDDGDGNNNDDDGGNENPIPGDTNPDAGPYNPSGGGGGIIDNPTDPGVTPEDPGTPPEDPKEDPTDPGTDPEDPSTPPEDPKEDPTDPGTDPEDPSTPPEDPKEDPTDPGTDPEDPSTPPEEPTEPSEEKSPDIKFVNVGPDKIEFGNTETPGNDYSIGGGGVISDGGGADFNEPAPVETPTEEPEYIWESMSPTVENPALESGLIDNLEVSQGDITSEVITPSETPDINITPPEVTAPEVEATSFANNTSNVDTILGMGGIAAGTTLSGVYANSKIKEKKEEKDDKKEKSKEKDNEGFNQQ